MESARDIDKKQLPSGKERRRKTLIVGLGKTGLSCARYLASRGVPWAVTDTRENPPGLEQLNREMPDAGLFLGSFNADVFRAAERLVVSPGVPLSEKLIQQAIKQGLPVLGDIELFCQAVKAPVAVVTGSNGKSTVTTLVGEMTKAAGLRVGVGGNLGMPALDLLSEDTELYVLELSSFQLETTYSLRPQVAAVLNVSPDHLDRYRDLQEYADTKAKVYHQAGIKIVNRDDPRVTAMVAETDIVLGYTLEAPREGDFGLLQASDGCWIAQGSRPLLAVSELLIPGRHNQQNALAALAMGTALDLPEELMLETLRTFPGLPHRTQFVGEHRGVRWYNDSKGTNPGACVAALEGLHEQESDARTVLIAGGDSKGADFSPLGPVVSRTARAVVLIGRDADLIASALEPGVPVFRAGNMEEAVALAAEQALEGDRVLFSPACASFDMFDNYEHRGAVFIKMLVRFFQ